MPYIIYFDIESLIRKIDGCANKPENFLTKKWANMFLVDIQCQLYGLLISMVYFVGRLCEKKFVVS